MLDGTQLTSGSVLKHHSWQCSGGHMQCPVLTVCKVNILTTVLSLLPLEFFFTLNGFYNQRKPWGKLTRRYTVFSSSINFTGSQYE